MILHVLDALTAARLEPIVVAKADTVLPPLDCRIVVEPANPRKRWDPDRFKPDWVA